MTKQIAVNTKITAATTDIIFLYFAAASMLPASRFLPTKPKRSKSDMTKNIAPTKYLVLIPESYAMLCAGLIRLSIFSRPKGRIPTMAKPNSAFKPILLVNLVYPPIADLCVPSSIFLSTLVTCATL